MTLLTRTLEKLLSDVLLYCELASRVKLRKYQEEITVAIINSVVNNLGLEFVVIMPRQSGKNEIQAEIESYLMLLFSKNDLRNEMVKGSPTWKPQSQNAMRRIKKLLMRNLITKDLWKSASGYIYSIGNVNSYYFSTQPDANVVGATASLLLQCDEAQETSASKWDKEFLPMVAATNSTIVYYGTEWSDKTLLAREAENAINSQKADGIKRLFKIDTELVFREVPAYKKFVMKQVVKMGRNHPIIKTQYFNERIGSEGGLFPPERIAAMGGDHLAQVDESGSIYAFLIDVGGAEEGEEIDELEKTKKRDSTALTIVEVDLTTLEDELIKKPTYKVIFRQLWTGVQHSQLFVSICALIDQWKPQKVVVDATGLGQGLSSFMQAKYPTIVIPFLFTRKSKSDLGWGIIAMIETGRFKDHKDDTAQKKEFITQLEHVKYKVTNDKKIAWSVPDGTRDIKTGELVYDDWVMSGAMSWVLDSEAWSISESVIVEVDDIFEEMSEVY